jgi:hypothetical protein
VAGIIAEPRCEPWLWQLAHALGVPLNMPPMWQVSQRTTLCAPVSGKPVLKWLNWVLEVVA